MTFSDCTDKCWTPVDCPTCGNTLPPRGRSVPLAMHIGQCCEEIRWGSRINPRHLWSPDDEERWRFHPKLEGADES